MGREVRRVPADWKHPERSGRYEPLKDDYRDDLAKFEGDIADMGLAKALDYWGGGPVSDDYMPDWPEAERTHYQMYENTSEGTPISPPLASPEEVARWCADNGASSFGSDTANYDQWLAVARGGWAPSAVYSPQSGLVSGVAFIADNEKSDGVLSA